MSIGSCCWWAAGFPHLSLQLLLGLAALLQLLLRLGRLVPAGQGKSAATTRR
jgi:hypothetical protein